LVSLVAARLGVPLLAASYVTMIECVIGSPNGAGPPSAAAHGTIMPIVVVPIGGTKAFRFLALLAHCPARLQRMRTRWPQAGNTAMEVAGRSRAKTD
jgi:hypothetical protein